MSYQTGVVVGWLGADGVAMSLGVNGVLASPGGLETSERHGDGERQGIMPTYRYNTIKSKGELVCVGNSG